MSAQVTYSGNPADWSGEVPPSRDEALLLAARAAAAAGDVMIPPDAAVARAAQSRAWSAVAALADDMEANYARKVGQRARSVEHLPSPDVRCGHGQTVFWSGASWVHPMDMGICDRPVNVPMAAICVDCGAESGDIEQHRRDYPNGSCRYA